MRMVSTGIAMLLLGISATAGAQDKTLDWRALAGADVEAAYTETKDNHPGMHDPKNPGFPKLLESARAEALKLAEQTTSAGGFQATLNRFKAVLNDGHAGAYASLPEALEPPIKWPGFVTAWRGNAMYVFRSEKGGPAEGAQVISCDGVPVKALVERNYFRFKHGKEVPGEWWSGARRLFVDDGNPFVILPKQCLFRQGAKNQNLKLSWSVIPDYYQAWKNGSSSGDLLPIGMTEKAPGLFWYAMPDFQPDEAGEAAYKKMYEETAVNRKSLLKARAIVLDLRFNQGGSSEWSKVLAEQLWGEASVTRKMKDYSANTKVWWRPTTGNLSYIIGSGPNAAARAESSGVKMLRAALEKGDIFLAEPNSEGTAIPSNVSAPAELKTPVYVIVHGQCASACLDAIDYFKRFPNTRLIGAPSGADSTYMEVRSPQLPSGMGGAIIPMKMYVDRPRGNGEYYMPDILMDGFDWSTIAFQKRIEADLATKPDRN